jgi:organic hydroperoxide reductase OsmC/OhrA
MTGEAWPGCDDGWSASLESAISAAARQRKIVFPPGLAIEAEVDLCLADGACFLQARLNVSLPGVEQRLRDRTPTSPHIYHSRPTPAGRRFVEWSVHAC